MALGSVTVGVLLQRRILDKYSVMALGALAVCLGLLVTFPPESLPAVYNLAPVLAFPGVFLAGFGDPLITLAALRALFDLQVSQITSIKMCLKVTPRYLSFNEVAC